MHLELLGTARKLIAATSDAGPSSTDLKRAVSTAYYALFHFVSQSSADDLTAGGSRTLSRAASQIYRSLDHRDIAGACEKARLVSTGFPKEISDFAQTFLKLRKSRHAADYDPTSQFHFRQVEKKIDDAERAINAFAASDRDDRRAFAILVAVKAPPRNRG